MTIESAITFFIAIFIFGITPGPGIFAILARSMLHGAKSCFWLSTGMVISDILYLIMACFGLATIAQAWEEAFFVIRIVGAAYLLYLGWKMWVAPLPEELSSKEPLSKESDIVPAFPAYGVMSSFTQGFLISASNPKVILFYIAFLPTFMDVTALSQTDIILASALTFVALLSGLSLVAAGAAQARRYLRSARAVKYLNRSAGSIMMSAGVYIGFRG
ncbi:putative threonine efflux protein [gamma proteobacterium IMCC1989]|nr:putative threonine efflux protein [gamma proteobacterium IMCC1989]